MPRRRPAPPLVEHTEVLILRGGYTPCSAVYREATDRLSSVEARLAEQGVPRCDWQYDAEWSAAEDRLAALQYEGHLGKFVPQEQPREIVALIDAMGGNPL